MTDAKRFTQHRQKLLKEVQLLVVQRKVLNKRMKLLNDELVAWDNILLHDKNIK